MATLTYTDSAEVKETLSSLAKKEISLSTLNSKASSIPPYSKINSVKAYVDAKQNLGGSKTDVHFFWHADSKNIGTISIQYEVVTTSYQTFSCDITKRCASESSNAGYISYSKDGTAAIALRVYNQCDVIRTLYLKNFKVVWDYTPPTYKIALTAGTGGTVSGAGTYDVGSTATIKATPNTGYKFVKWSDGNTNAERKITITTSDISANVTNRSYTATFEKIKYTISVSGSNGTVSGGGTYEVGSSVTLTATPNSGYKFVKWSDGNTSNPRTITVSGNATYTAVFERSTCTISFKNADGSVVSTKTLNSGATLGTLPTISRSGYTFVGWIPCAPVKKIDNTILDSCYYNGSVAYPLIQSYKYTDNLSMHIDVYMEDWMDIKSSSRQVMSCTESGGWGFGYQANSKVDGAEAHGFEVHTGSYTGYDLKFGTSGEYTNNKWYSFDIIFSNGVIEAFVNGASKGKRTASSSTIKYNPSNTIFVGGEAKGDTSSAQNYFKGYISNVFIANQGTKLEIATTNTVVEKDIEYYPIWRKNTAYTVTFKNHDGTVLQTSQVEHENIPSYTGSTPTKSSTAEYSYSFSGWSPSIGTITSATTYTAQFTATKRKYTISVSGSNGSVGGGGTYEYGSSVALTATPNTGCKFVKWSDGNTNNPRTVTVTGNATYTAIFEQMARIFIDADRIKGLLIDTNRIKAILIDTTKVYG